MKEKTVFYFPVQKVTLPENQYLLDLEVEYKCEFFLSFYGFTLKKRNIIKILEL